MLNADVAQLAEGVKLYHAAQLDEGMEPLPEAETALAKKYCGGGFGGYALYLFGTPADRDAWVATDKNRRAIEPWCK